MNHHDADALDRHITGNYGEDQLREVNDMTKRFQDVKVKLVGTDGNAFAVLGTVMRALRNAGATEEEVEQFKDEATNGGYDHLLATCMKWVDVS